MKISNNRINQVFQSGTAQVNKKDLQQKTSSNNQKLAEPADSIDISGEALKFAGIREKIANGFYDRPEVLNTLASKLDRIISDNVDETN
jgi:hypothetical protein